MNFEYQLLDCDYDEVIDKGGVEGMRTESQQTLYLLHFKAVPDIACFLLIYMFSCQSEVNHVKCQTLVW